MANVRIPALKKEILAKRQVVTRLGNFEHLTADQRSQFEAAAEELTQMEAELIDAQEREQAVGNVGDIYANFGSGRELDVPEADLQRVRGADARGRVRSWVERDTREFRSDDQREAVTKLLDREDETADCVARLALATGTDEYREAWVMYLLGGEASLRDSQRAILRRGLSAREERTMTAGTGSTGGYFVPLYLDPTMIITGSGTANRIRDVSDVRQCSTLVYNGVSAAQITSSEVAENAVFTDNSPTATQIQSTMLKAGCYIPASFEAFEDIMGLANDVGELIADSKAVYEANRLTLGLGTTQPTGIITGVTAVTSSRASPATGGAFVVGDVYTTHQSLPPRYRASRPQNKAFMANVSTINTMRQFATANVYHAFLTDLAGGQPPNLIGEQLIEASDMASTITTGTNLLLYGDFSRFLVIDRVGLQTEFIPNVFASTGVPTGTRAWLAHWRWNTALADAAAFRLLKL